MRKTIILAAVVIGLFSGAYAKPAAERLKTSSDHAITAPVPSEAGAKTAADVGPAKVKPGSPVKSLAGKNSGGGTCNSYGCSDGGTCNSYGCSQCGTCSSYGCPNCSSLKNSDKTAIQLTNDGAGQNPAPVVRH